MRRLILITLMIALPAAAGGLSDWPKAALLGVDMAGDAPPGLDLLSFYLDRGDDGSRLRLSLVQVVDPGSGETLLPPGAEFHFDFGAAGKLVAASDDLLAARGHLLWTSSGGEQLRLSPSAPLLPERDSFVWHLEPGLLPSAFFDPNGEPLAFSCRSVFRGEVADEFASARDRDYAAHCALMQHGNQSLTYTDVFHGRWNDLDGSGFDEALQVHEATGVPGNFHLSGPLQTSAHWDHLNGDPDDFNAWLAAGVSAGWAGMVTSVYAQHIMPFVTDEMNSWAVNIQTDMTYQRYGYFPTVAWVPERCWLTPGQYPDAGVIDYLADDFLEHGIGAVILDDYVHCLGYDGHQIHTLAGSSLRIIPRDDTFTGRLHAGDGAGALAVLTGLAGSGVGDYRIAVYADDWEMAAEIGEWATTMPHAKETYDWFVWKCHDESAWLHTWKLSDAVANPNFQGVTSMNITNGTHGSIGGTHGYGGGNNAWYSHWAGFVPWVTGGNGEGYCAGSGGSCQNYGDMWAATLADLDAAPASDISEAGWYVMMTNLYETGWHDYVGGPISGWEHHHSSHIKNGRYFAQAAHWGAGEWDSPGLNAFAIDVDGDGYDEVLLHNQRLLAMVETSGGRIVHLSVRDGDLADTAVGCDNVYWYGTDGDFNDGNHTAALSDVSPDWQSLPFAWSIDEVCADSVQVTLSRDGISKTLILRTGEPTLRVLYSVGDEEVYTRSGFSPSLVSLIWNPEMERVWDPQARYMGWRNPATGLTAGMVVGDAGAEHSSEFSGRLMMGDELRGDHRFEFLIFAAQMPEPVGGEIAELESLASGLVDVLAPAVSSAIYFPGTDLLRLDLDQDVDRAAVLPDLIGIDDDGDGTADLTLDLATAIEGFGWGDRLDLTLLPADADILEGLDTANLSLLLAAGAFFDGSGLPNAPLTGETVVHYGPPTIVTIDGSIDHSEWNYCRIAIDDPDNDSAWGLLNELQTLYLGVDESYLYLGLEGRIEPFNGWLIHLDVDFGNGTGESDLGDLPWWDKNAVFTFPETGIDFLYGSWGGDDGNFYSIDGPSAMTILTDSGVVLGSDMNAAWPGSELALPWDLLYGLGENAVVPGAVLGLSAAIAGGVELGGDVMPNNLSAVLPIIDLLGLIELDTDGDGVPDGADNQAPVLLAAEATSDTTVLLHFSEAMDAPTAANPVFYEIHESLLVDEFLPVESATMQSGDSLVQLTTAAQRTVEYTVRVHGIRDASCAANEINPNSHVEFTGEATASPGLPVPNLALLPNWPNPFNPVTSIAFDLPEEMRVDLSVYDLSGRLVRELFEGSLPAGRHVEMWRGKNAHGHPCASGLYFAVLRGRDQTQVRKMILLR